MQEIGFKNQVILDFFLEFGFHFCQNTFVPHCFLFIFIGNELLNTSGLVLILPEYYDFSKLFKDLSKIKKNNANHISKLYSFLVFKKTDPSDGIVYEISE